MPASARARPPSGAAAPAARAAVAGNFSNLTRLVGLFRREFAARVAEADWAIEADVRPPTYGLLSVVGHLGPVSQREVSDIVGVHASDLVDVIDRAEAAGWVERRRDPSDRRRYQLTLTTAGRRILARYDAIAAEVEAAVLEPLDASERDLLNGLVAKVLG